MLMNFCEGRVDFSIWDVPNNFLTMHSRGYLCEFKLRCIIYQRLKAFSNCGCTHLLFVHTFPKPIVTVHSFGFPLQILVLARGKANGVPQFLSEGHIPACQAVHLVTAPTILNVGPHRPCAPTPCPRS